MNPFKEFDLLPQLSQIASATETVHLENCSGSMAAVVFAALFQNQQKPLLIIHDDVELAGQLYHDLCNLLADSEQVVFHPSSYRRYIHLNQTSVENIVLRTESLLNLTDNAHKIVITTPKSLMEKVVEKESMQTQKFTIKKGQSLDLEDLTQHLLEVGFVQEDFVFEPGQFAIRGGILDVFSFASDNPVRVSLFGDEVEHIKPFDVESQLSISQQEQLEIAPNFTHETESLTDLFSLLLPDTCVCTNNYNYVLERIGNEFDELEKEQQAKFLSPGFVREQLQQFKQLEFGFQSYLNAVQVFDLQAAPQPVFNRNFDLLIEDLKAKHEELYHLNILYKDPAQVERLQSIIEQHADLPVNFVPTLLHKGFVLHEPKVCFYTDHEIFGRYHKTRVRNNISQKRAGFNLKEIHNLQKGDYVVHTEYGVGQFVGLHKMTNLGKKQEVIKLAYEGGDNVYVNLHALHKVSKYKSKDGLAPKLNKLGSKVWQAKKSKVKTKLKELAVDLIQLYAKRKHDKAFAFSPDSFLQEELEASFLYEDTPDQHTTTQAVKQDMESDKTMDRLVCGDVGFGKTEIAIRAAFKAACDGKQVAVLVPTTILAFQHHRSFAKRLKRLPCKVDYLTRFRSTKDKARIKQELASGELNILIGTHAIANKNMIYKDLGLLIIDEEQKFGVSVKEKLKELKANVDTLTLTATPIPRTLQFSLMGARDISVIKTPPPNRIPITTEVHGFNTKIIREAIKYEVERGGQVYFVHNRVQNIEEVQGMLHRVVPGINSIIVHGQMSGKEIEERLIAFINGEYDLLLATSIIENGIDIPNANTIIINNANHFGLSDLHQMRGRVGRSNKKAFCYLISPELHSLPPESQQRMRVIAEYSDLGSGINIAMQDMDIRGTGNLFGAEQSGFISDIGYETYIKILNETIKELKHTQFSDLYQEELKKEISEGNYVDDCSIETDLDILLPDDYVANVPERLNLYRRIDGLESKEQMDSLKAELLDKFGEMPEQAVQLFEVVELRWLAKKLGFEKISLKNGRMTCYFVADASSKYFESEVFVGILNFAQTQSKQCELQEGKRLMLKVRGVEGVGAALGLLGKVL